MAVAQFRGDLTQAALDQSLRDLIAVAHGPDHYFRMLDVNPTELAGLLRGLAAATDMGDKGGIDAV